jgi:hypothetical protein
MKDKIIAGFLGALIVATGVIATTDSSATACAKHRHGRSVSHSRMHRRNISSRIVERRYVVNRVVERPVYVERPVVVQRRAVVRRVIETPVVVRKRERGIIPKVYSLIFGG